MSVLAARRRLDSIVEVLLNERASSSDLTRAASDLYQCLSEPVTSLLTDAPGSGTSLANGFALSPADAAACTKDPARTAKFLRAANAALRQALQLFSGETIEVVYAGTGPIAPLVIPLMPRFENRRVRFTFIDIHAEATRSARAVIDHFELSRAMRDFVTGDATAYEHPHGHRLHVIITETMQRALTREPQVAVVRQLARQLVPGGILVPESVRVDLVLGEVGTRGKDLACVGTAADEDVFVATLIDVRASIAAVPLDTNGCLPSVRVTMPSGSRHPFLQAIYRTTIVASGEHVISSYESGLTHAEIAWDLMPIEAGSEFEFRYHIGPKPGLLWRRAA